MANKFYIEEQFRERFYQLPKVFFTNPKYMKLSNDAKIAYAILRDRLELSIKNNWVDEDNAIYFIFTNDNLEHILNASKPKVIKIKKELENTELLEQKRLGLNRPNMLYLMKPIVNENDIYKLSEEEKQLTESSNGKEVNNFNFQKLNNFTSGSKDILLQEVNNFNSSDTDISDTDISDTDISDMNDVNDTYNVISESSHNTHSSHSNHQSQSNDILSTQEEIQYELQEFPEHLAQYITNYTLPEVRIIKGVILKAKRSFHDERAQEIMHPYPLEDIEQELINVLKRFRIVLKKKNESVESMQSYLMRCVKSEFEEIHALHMRQQHMPKDNIFKF